MHRPPATASGVAFEALEARVLLSADAAGAYPFPIDTVLPPVDATSVWLTKCNDDSILSYTLREARATIEERLAADAAASLSDLTVPSVLRVDDSGRIQVYVHVEGVSSTVVESLQAAGLSVETSNADMRIVQGWVSYSLLDNLAGVSGVRQITPPGYAICMTEVTSEGDSILDADLVRSQFAQVGQSGITGAGIKVGVISDGVYNLSAAQATGDLPETIQVDPDRSGFDYCNEGTAMLEIIHDLAPGAELYFSGPGTSAQMVDSIDWLVDQGVDVIVDDIRFFDQPWYQDGAVANAATSAVAADVVYVTAAGNQAQLHYQGNYAPADNGFHDFGSGQPVDNVFITRSIPSTDPDLNITVGILQWDDIWGESGNDYSLWLFGWNPTSSTWDVIAWTTVVQNGDDAPREGIAYHNTTYDLLGWAFRCNAGSVRELEFYSFKNVGAYAYETHATPTDSIFGQGAVESVITVGAISAADQDWNTVENFSSRGPSKIYDPATQTWTTRNSLDGCGIDGVHTQMGEQHIFGDPYDSWEFHGTSAAAPHVAAIAALMLQANPELHPDDVSDALHDTAIDLYATGYDDTSGYGRFDALGAVYKVFPLDTAPDLTAGTDLGVSYTDNLTCDDTPTFTGTVPLGSHVHLYVDDVQCGEQQLNANQDTYSITPTTALAAGTRQVTIRVGASGNTTENNLSQASPSLAVTIDTTHPTANIAAVSPDPRSTSVTSLEIGFDEAIASGTFGREDLDLTREGGVDLLAEAQTLTAGSGNTWTLGNLSGITAKAGQYTLTLTAAGSDITDLAGNALNGNATRSWVMNTIDGTTGSDAITLKNSNGLLEVTVNQDAAYTLDPAHLSLLYVKGLTGNDTLTLDLTAGTPDLPANGVDFDGGDGGADILAIVGSSGADTVTLSSTQATVGGETVAYSNVEKHSLSMGGGNDNVTLGAGTFAFDDDAFLLGEGTADLTLATGCSATFNDSLNLASLDLQGNATATFAYTDPRGTGSFVLRTKNLSIAEDANGNPTARLDLTTNYLILDYGASDPNPAADVAAWVSAGYNAASGYWNGYGITSSTAADEANLLTALGVIDNTSLLVGQRTTFAGQTVDDTCILIKYTYWGDINFDGSVTFDDYDVIDYYYWFPPPANQTGWWTGDFDMDTNIDFDDYDKIDYAYWFQGTPLVPGGDSLMGGGDDSLMANESDSLLSDSPASYTYDNPALHDWIRQQLGWERDGAGLPPTRPQDRL